MQMSAIKMTNYASNLDSIVRKNNFLKLPTRKYFNTMKSFYPGVGVRSDTLNNNNTYRYRYYKRSFILENYEDTQK